ncbi:MAG: RNA polymerase sporulation sigma factor SigG [Clostridia bacterium]|nr:RNA polymerase sporulation sigma factor SigG [Clostridia bacterium]
MALYKVEICGIDTSKLPLMNAAQSAELISKLKSGDNSAREELICGNLRLVLSVIQRFAGRNEPMDDLFQVGCVGLIKAIDNFDTSHDVRFSTYAVPMIIGEVRRFLRDSSQIRVSRSLRDIAYRALMERNRLSFELGREPTVEELAKAAMVRPEQIVFALEAIQDPVSIFEPVYHDDGDAIYVIDQVKDESDSEEKWLNNIAIRMGIDKLPEREQKIIRMRFFEGKTQMEVSSEIGISQAQVSRLEKSALKSMRKFV